MIEPFTQIDATMLVIIGAILLVTITLIGAIKLTKKAKKRKNEEKIKAQIPIAIVMDKCSYTTLDFADISFTVSNELSQTVTVHNLELILPGDFFSGFLILTPNPRPSSSISQWADGRSIHTLTWYYREKELAPSESLAVTIPMVANVTGNYSGSFRVIATVSVEEILPPEEALKIEDSYHFNIAVHPSLEDI